MKPSRVRLFGDDSYPMPAGIARNMICRYIVLYQHKQNNRTCLIIVNTPSLWRCTIIRFLLRRYLRSTIIRLWRTLIVFKNVTSELFCQKSNMSSKMLQVVVSAKCRIIVQLCIISKKLGVRLFDLCWYVRDSLVLATSAYDCILECIHILIIIRYVCTHMRSTLMWYRAACSLIFCMWESRVHSLIEPSTSCY